MLNLEVGCTQGIAARYGTRCVSTEAGGAGVEVVEAKETQPVADKWRGWWINGWVDVGVDVWVGCWMS